jgi:tetratricopeptide (TPR) repeat protein
MRLHRLVCVVLVVGALGAAAWSRSSNAKKSNPSSTTTDSEKIPITTRSEDAKKEFLLGRDLSDRLLAQESLQHFDKAIKIDPEFASAELARANSSATTKDFFDHQKRAISLADKVSEGERLLILANEAGANGDAVKQKEYLEKLVTDYPNDERAHLTRQSIITRRLQHWRRVSRQPITSSATRIGKNPTSATPRWRSKNISS